MGQGEEERSAPCQLSDDELRSLLDELLAACARESEAKACVRRLEGATREIEARIAAVLQVHPEHGVTYRGFEFEAASDGNWPPRLWSKRVAPCLDRPVEGAGHG